MCYWKCVNLKWVLLVISASCAVFSVFCTIYIQRPFIKFLSFSADHILAASFCLFACLFWSAIYILALFFHWSPCLFYYICQLHFACKNFMIGINENPSQKICLRIILLWWFVIDNVMIMAEGVVLYRKQTRGNSTYLKSNYHEKCIIFYVVAYNSNKSAKS